MATPTAQTAATDLVVTTRPNTDDAQLVVQLAQLGTSMNIELGTSLLFSHRETGGLTHELFKQTYATGSPESIAILNVLKWHETIGTLVKQGLLDRGLVLDWLWVAGAWETCQPIAMAQRAASGVPSLWENFEALAAGQTC
jgi:hypothetical protein